jgi:hypothetical protein
VSSPRLRESDHRVSALLIRLSGNPWSLVAVFVVSVLFWTNHNVGHAIGVGGLLVGMIDILSNMYQEVAADKRQEELVAMFRGEMADLKAELSHPTRITLF